MVSLILVVEGIPEACYRLRKEKQESVVSNVKVKRLLCYEWAIVVARRNGRIFDFNWSKAPSRTRFENFGCPLPWVNYTLTSQPNHAPGTKVSNAIQAQRPPSDLLHPHPPGLLRKSAGKQLQWHLDWKGIIASKGKLKRVQKALISSRGVRPPPARLQRGLGTREEFELACWHIRSRWCRRRNSNSSFAPIRTDLRYLTFKKKIHWVK